MKTVKREDIDIEDFQEIFAAESHHDHEVIEDEHGTLRWKRNDQVDKLVTEMNLNNIWALFYHMGLNKNSEEVRKIYRDMGYSLNGYWEIFYWEVNNELASEYRKK